jgi:hypothetical protein
MEAAGTHYDFTIYQGPGIAPGQRYKHYSKPLLNPRGFYSYLSADPGLKNLDPDVLFWEYDDFSGGEGDGLVGSILYHGSDPTVYDNADGNPRIPGQYTAAPTRTDGNIKTGLTATLGTFGFLAYAGGLVWHGSNDGDTTPSKLSYSSDGATWSQLTPVGAADGTDVPDSTGFFITGMAGKGDYLYVSLSQTVDMNPGGLHIRRISTTSNDLVAEAAAAQETKGMAVLQNYLYRWTGQKLSQYDTTQTLPLDAGSIVYSAGLDVDPATVNSGAVATNNSIAMFASNPGFTEIHEFKDGVGSPIWTPPEGFTALAMGHSLNNLFVAGTYNDSACLWRFDLNSRQDFFVGYFRRGTALIPQYVAAGMGAQVLIGMTLGKVFVYDAEWDSITLLDDVTSNGDQLLTIGTFLSTRLATFRDSTNLRFRSSGWAEDTDVPASRSTTLETGEWDYALPMEPKKVLYGVHVRSTALSSTSTIQVSYNLDGAGYVPLTTLTSGTDNFCAVADSSGSFSFGNARFKMTLAGTSGSACPVVKRLVPRAEDWNFREQWDLLVDLSDEPGGGLGQTGRAPATGNTKRAWLWSLMTNRVLVKLWDGYRQAPQADGPFGDPDATCIIKDIEDFATAEGQGYALVTLSNIEPVNGAG